MAKELTVKDLLDHAFSENDCVAIMDCDAAVHNPEKALHFMAIKTARDCWSDWLVDMFCIDSGIYSKNDKVLRLYVYKK